MKILNRNIGKKELIGSSLAVIGLVAVAIHGNKGTNVPIPVSEEPDTYAGFYKTTKPELYVFGEKTPTKNNTLAILLGGSCVRIIKPTISDQMVRVRITTWDGKNPFVYAPMESLEKITDPSMTLANCKVRIGQMPETKPSETYIVTAPSPLTDVLTNSDNKNVTVESGSCVVQHGHDKPENGFQRIDAFGKTRVVGGLIETKNLAPATGSEPTKCYATLNVDRAPDGTAPTFNIASFYSIKVDNTPLFNKASKDATVIARAKKDSCVTYQPRSSTEEFASVIAYPNVGDPFKGYVAKSALEPADNKFSLDNCPLVRMP